MSGFDPSKFVKREAARPDAEQSVAGPAPDAERSLLQNSVAEKPADQPFRRKRGKTVAGVATVAALDPDKPYYRELNAMFESPIPPIFRGGRWRELCEDIRAFVHSGRAAKALELGWELIEIFGAPREPWKRPTGVRYPPLAADSFVFQLRGRSAGIVEAHRIEILNPPGRSQYCYRAHHMSNRFNCDPIWQVFDPKVWPRIGTEDRIMR